MLETFHFLRPEWLIAIPIVALFLLLHLRRSGKNSGWEDICDPALLNYQLAQRSNTKNRSFNFLHWTVPVILTLGIFSLAGPTWEKKEQPVFQQGNALVIILDLSFSMNARDLKPSRLERAKLKLIDILKQKKEGQTALIAFAGDAHTVSPLTIDSKTIMSLLPALDSSIMPLTGSHLLDALATAKQLFKNAGFAQGDILLLSDGVDSSQQKALASSIKKLRRQGYRFSVIGVGSPAGSPIPTPGQGGFIKDQSGQVVLSKLAPEPLKKLASIGGGAYYKLSLDDSDFHDLIAQQMDQDNHLTDQDKQLEQWVDAGAYFTLLLIPLALLNFRKGLFSLLICLSISSSFIAEPTYAEADSEPAVAQLNTNNKLNKHWKNLWSTPDQQGQQSFDMKDYQNAAASFSDNNWKASAYYRAGNYEKALQQYTQSDGADSLYNKGNTLANMNKFQEAIKAYEEAVKNAPASDKNIKKNAQQNIDYLNELLAQQNKQSSEKNADKNKEDSEQQSENQDQEQQNSSDDASKSNNSDADESEKNNSEDSNSEGSESGEKEEENQDSEKDKDKDSTAQDNQNEENQPNDLDEAKSPDEPMSPEKPKSPEKPESHDEPKSPEKPEPLKEDAKQQTQNQSKAESDEDDENHQENTNAPQNDVLSQLSQEEQQSLKQWLQRIPDNPGELLRIKFRNNTLLKQRQSGSTDAQYEGNPW